MCADVSNPNDDGPTPGEKTGPADAETRPSQFGNSSDAAGGYSIYRSIHTCDPPLEECLDRFWTMPEPIPADEPASPHTFEPYEILKRLGPSPFQNSTFPLIGFLATTYERVSRFAGERTEA